MFTFPTTEKKISTGEKLDLSVIIPTYNEAENIPLMANSLLNVLSGMNFEHGFEIIFIDDGSKDGSADVLKDLAQKNERIKAIKFRRNYGQTAAMAAGFDYASGDIIISMDGDLQNDPVDIPRLLEKLNEGYDVVSGWRKDRQDDLISRKIPSMIANKLIGALTGVRLHDYGCSLKAYTSEIAKEVSLYGELHRFIPALASIEGGSIAEIPVTHHARQFGKSKYNIKRTFKVILDLLTVVFLRKFMTRPLHVFGRMGLASLLAGILTSTYLVYEKLFVGENIGSRPLLLLGILLIITGIQLISTGIIAEIAIRTYFESQGKAIYKIKEVYT